MKEPFLRAFFASVAVALAVPALAIGSSSSKPRVLVVDFPLEVNPVTANYLDHQIHRAQDKGYNAVVIKLDTPGGLSDSMRTIVKNELSSKIPVIVYVAPHGRPRGLGRRLDRSGGRRAGDGADDEHRLFDPDRVERREHRERPPAQGRQ